MPCTKCEELKKRANKIGEVIYLLKVENEELRAECKALNADIDNMVDEYAHDERATTD